MRAGTAGEPAALLAELAALGIELQARGDRIRFRPLSAMTAELVARVKAHKPALLALLTVTITKTPAGAGGNEGFGDGDAGDEARMLVDAPADLLAAVESIKRAFPGAELASVQRIAPDPPPGDAAAWPAGDALRALPADIAELVRERVGWTPAAWRGWLLHLAAACAALNPDRAALLRRAADELAPGPPGHCPWAPGAGPRPLEGGPPAPFGTAGSRERRRRVSTTAARGSRGTGTRLARPRARPRRHAAPPWPVGRRPKCLPAAGYKL
jgi:hypothetical protein